MSAIPAVQLVAKPADAPDSWEPERASVQQQQDQRGPWGPPTSSAGALECLYTELAAIESLDSHDRRRAPHQGPLRPEEGPARPSLGPSQSLPSLPCSAALLDEPRSKSVAEGPLGPLDALISCPLREGHGGPRLRPPISSDEEELPEPQQQQPQQDEQQQQQDGQQQQQDQQRQQPDHHHHQQQQQQQDEGVPLEGSEEEDEVAVQLRLQLQRLRAEGRQRAARLRRERQQLQQELAEARQQQQVLLLKQQQQQRSCTNSNSSSNEMLDAWPAPYPVEEDPSASERGPLGRPQGAPFSAGWPPFSPQMVLLHIYDLTPAISTYVNTIMRPLGAGAFHAGVEVFGHEYCFGQTADETTGICVCLPRKHPAHVYRETVLMGPTDLGADEFVSLMEALKSEWPGNSYDVLSRNCLNFADYLCVLLGVGNVPSWLFRLQNQANTLKGGARAAAAAAAAAARQLQQLDREARISATATAAAEAAATAAGAAATAAADAAVSLGRLLKRAHQNARFPTDMGSYLFAGVSFLSDRLAGGISCIPLEWHEDDCGEIDAHQAFDRAPLPPPASHGGPRALRDAPPRGPPGGPLEASEEVAESKKGSSREEHQQDKVCVRGAPDPFVYSGETLLP